MPFSIREYAESDARDIARLHQESSGCFEEFNVTSDFINSIAHRHDFRFLIASDGDGVIGFIGFLYHVGVGRAEVGPICVRSDSRNQGMGSRLLLAATAQLIEQGIRRIIVKVKVKNKKALSFFQENGFVQEGYFKRYTVEGDDVVQLRKFV